MTEEKASPIWEHHSGTAFGQSGESTVSMSVDFADYNRMD